MIVMYIAWMLIRRPGRPTPNLSAQPNAQSSSLTPLSPVDSGKQRGGWWYNDLVDVDLVDLYRDEHNEEEEDRVDDSKRERRLKGTNSAQRILWRMYYWLV